MNQYETLSFCGIYCGGCKNYKKNMNCSGCRNEKQLVDDCPTRSCAIKRGFLHCGECENFPCNELNDFYKDGIQHHELAFQNMLKIKEIGIEKWLLEQEKEHTCECGGDYMINEAIIFATNAHRNQTRKGSDIPYILHPLEAGIIVSQIKYNEELITAAILHDTVEDAGVSIETIKEKFGMRVAELVSAESEDKSKSWKERKKHTIEHLKSESDQDLKIVTLGDKLSNIKAMYKDYLIIGDKLWERFNEKDKKEQRWYYEGLVEALASLSEFQAYGEFRELVLKVFNEN